MIWARMLAYITGTVDQELLLRNEYLAAENRILRAQIKGRLVLPDAEKATLAEIAHRLGRRAFTVEVLTLTGLITYYVLFFIHLESRRICLAGVTRHPEQEWMEQMERNVTMEDSGLNVMCNIQIKM